MLFISQNHILVVTVYCFGTMFMFVHELDTYVSSTHSRFLELLLHLILMCICVYLVLRAFSYMKVTMFCYNFYRCNATLFLVLVHLYVM